MNENYKVYEDQYLKNQVMIKNIYVYPQFVSCVIVGNGHSFLTYIGKDTSNFWISFPELEKASFLSHLSDTFWNSDKLSCLFNNQNSGSVLALALKILDRIEVFS